MKPDKQYLQLLTTNIVERSDEKSFEKLFNLFYGRLVSFSEHYTHNRELSEEIVSEVFVKIWNKRKEIGDINNIESYLFIAVKNQSLNNLSKTQFSSIEVSAMHQPELSNLIEVFNPEKELETQELLHSINIAIDSLPPQCRTVFKMIKEDGMKYKEVAEILNISSRTVETQLVRALKRLDVALAPYVEKKVKKQRAKAGGMMADIRKFFTFL